MDFSNSTLLNTFENIINIIDANYCDDNSIITIRASGNSDIGKTSKSFLDDDNIEYNIDGRSIKNYNQTNSASNYNIYQASNNLAYPANSYSSINTNVNTSHNKASLKNSKSYQQFLIDKMKLESKRDVFSKINDKELFLSLIYIANKQIKTHKKSHDMNKTLKDNEFHNDLCNNKNYFEGDGYKVQEINFDNFRKSGLKPYTKKRFKNTLKKEFQNPLKKFKITSKNAFNRINKKSDIKAVIEMIILFCVENKNENFEELLKKIRKNYSCKLSDVINIWQVFRFFVNFQILSKQRKYLEDEDFWKILLGYLKE